jgi:hypothetical protein
MTAALPAPDSAPCAGGATSTTTALPTPPALERAAATSSRRCCSSSAKAAESISTVANRGARRLPDSNAEIALGLRPARSASCSCVSPAATRKRRSKAPNGAGDCFATFAIFAEVSMTGPRPTVSQVAVNAAVSSTQTQTCLLAPSSARLSATTCAHSTTGSPRTWIRRLMSAIPQPALADRAASVRKAYTRGLRACRALCGRCPRVV